jgi:REP element-mobilizing transposase RayT
MLNAGARDSYHAKKCQFRGVSNVLVNEGGLTMNNEQNKGWYNRGYLPHFDEQNRIQMVNFRLDDSMPMSVIEKFERRLTEMMHMPDNDVRSREIARLYYKREEYLDKGFGSCLLGEPLNAKIVVDTLKYFHLERYELIAWVVMPNHVHVIIKLREGYQLSKQVISWKKFSSRQINERLNSSKSIWQTDYYDRFIRNEKHLMDAVNYIHNNPVKAGLVAKEEDWEFSSAKGWEIVVSC